MPTNLLSCPSKGYHHFRNYPGHPMPLYLPPPPHVPLKFFNSVKLSTLCPLCPALGHLHLPLFPTPLLPLLGKASKISEQLT